MMIRILTTGDRMPAWVEAGYAEFAKRFTAPFSLTLVEVPAEKRGKNADIQRIIEQESNKLFAATHPNSHVIALDVKGESWSTETLSTKLKSWQTQGLRLDLLVGGPDGLSQSCLQKAHGRWSLSALTFPHPLVRIILAEQLYRAISILKNHPYHRG